MGKINHDKNELKRIDALKERREEYRNSLIKKKPQEVATNAAMGFLRDKENRMVLCGEYFSKEYKIVWPGIEVVNTSGETVDLQIETLWLHYLDNADGTPVSGKWVNLSEIGALFYQQAFQGYSGDMLAAAWEGDIDGLEKACLSAGGWTLKGMADLAFEWRALPRVPICLCYRKPVGENNAWATILFDASSNHYLAADVAAIVGKKLADLLLPG